MFCQRGGLVIQRHNEKRENEKKRKYNFCVTEIEQGTFTPLVFTTTGRMVVECLRYRSRLAEPLSAKKARELRHNNFMDQGESVLCNFAERAPMHKGSRTPRMRNLDVKDRDLEIQKGQS